MPVIHNLCSIIVKVPFMYFEISGLVSSSANAWVVLGAVYDVKACSEIVTIYKHLCMSITLDAC
jgi:hypothetical protein